MSVRVGDRLKLLHFLVVLRAFVRLFVVIVSDAAGEQVRLVLARVKTKSEKAFKFSCHGWFGRFSTIFTNIPLKTLDRFTTENLEQE